MKIASFATIAEEFVQNVHAQVWCSVATLDTHGRLRTRVLHPIWELTPDGAVGWIATGRHSPKAAHLAHNPHLSLCYMVDPIKPTYVDCTGIWLDDMAEKQRIGALLAGTPPPLGYDPARFGWIAEQEGSGLLKLTPWRIELANLFGETRVWQSA